MNPLPFRVRHAEGPAFAVFLRKGDASRLYRIDLIGPSMWRCEVWFGATIHRTEVVSDRATLRRRREELSREVVAAIADGWSDV